MKKCKYKKFASEQNFGTFENEANFSRTTGRCRSVSGMRTINLTVPLEINLVFNPVFEIHIKMLIL